MRPSAIVAAVVLAVCGNVTIADCPPPGPGESDHADGLVQLRVADYATIDDALAMINASYPGTTVVGAIEARSTYVLEVPTGQVDCDVAEDLIANLVNPNPGTPDPTRPLVWAELDHEGEASEGSTGTVFVSSQFPPATAFYRTQYAGDLTGLTVAQVRSTGRGVAVAVLDTGIDADHPLLRDVMLAGYNFLTDSTDTADVGDGLDNDGDQQIDEMVGHGTFIAGLIHYAAPEARILPVVVLDSDGIGEAFRVAEGIYYAIDHGVEVINMSFGSTYESEIVEEALREARQRGIVVVAAAGNDNRREPARFPAVSGRAIGVMATDDHDIRAAFSNYHSDLLISAPGTSKAIQNGSWSSTGPLRVPMGGDATFGFDCSIFSAIPGGGIGMWEGTSISAAFVSGTVALIRAQHPEWAADAHTFDRIESLLADTAVNIDALNPGYAAWLGAGRLDAAAAVAQGPPQPPLGDLNADAVVNIADLAIMLADFGAVHSSADLNTDGRVDVGDLGMLLAGFGN